MLSLPNPSGWWVATPSVLWKQRLALDSNRIVCDKTINVTPVRGGGRPSHNCRHFLHFGHEFYRDRKAKVRCSYLLSYVVRKRPLHCYIQQTEQEQLTPGKLLPVGASDEYIEHAQAACDR